MLSLVYEELLLEGDKPFNSYEERVDFASDLRAKMNQRAGLEDKYSILVCLTGPMVCS